MNVAAFIEYLNKTKHLHLDADYYGNIEVWRQWWKGDVPDIHDQKEDAPDGSVISRRLASLRMPKQVCEDWANLLLNDKTTFQIGDAATSAYLLGSDLERSARAGLAASSLTMESAETIHPSMSEAELLRRMAL